MSYQDWVVQLRVTHVDGVPYQGLSTLRVPPKNEINQEFWQQHNLNSFRLMWNHNKTMKYSPVFARPSNLPFFSFELLKTTLGTHWECSCVPNQDIRSKVKDAFVKHEKAATPPPPIPRDIKYRKCSGFEKNFGRKKSADFWCRI